MITKLNFDTRNVVERRRSKVQNHSEFQNVHPNTNSTDEVFIEEIKNEYKTIPPEYLQSPTRPKVSFTRQMSLGDFF